MNACCTLEKDKYFGIFDIEFLLLQNPGSECVCTHVRGGWWSWSFCLRHRSLIPLYLPVTNVPVRECPSPQFVSPRWFGARLKTPRLPGKSSSDILLPYIPYPMVATLILLSSLLYDS